MITKKTVSEFIGIAREIATFVHKNTDKAESKDILRRFWAAIRAAEGELSDERAGYLLLVENANRGRRITATVEGPDGYLSRTGWESAGLEAEVTYSREVKSLSEARNQLKSKAGKENFMAHGMEWTQTPAKELIAIIDSVANSL